MLGFQRYRWVGSVNLVKLMSSSVAAAALTVTSAMADDIPSYSVLSCEKNCPQVVPARLLTPNNPIYPRDQVPEGAEGIVDVSFTVGTDGHTSNPILEQVIGDKHFAETAVSSLRGEQYQPATAGQKPITENKRERYMFLSPPNSLSGLRPDVEAAYQSALSGVKSDSDAGLAAMRLIVVRPDLKLQELETVSFSLAQLEAAKGNKKAALADIRKATLQQGLRLSPADREKAIRLRIDMEADAGEFAEALAWFEILKKQSPSPIAAEDEVSQTIDQIGTMRETAIGLQDEVKIPEGSDHWQHAMMRRVIDFEVIAGTVNNFVLRCDHHQFEATVSGKLQWIIPDSWGGCLIYVFGAPGSSFQFIEWKRETVPGSYIIPSNPAQTSVAQGSHS
jgi:hypothetical protein